MKKNIAVVAILYAISAAAAGAQVQPVLDDAAVRIPLTVSETRAGTYKIGINVAFGNLASLPIGFDTGSTGLRVFADANLDAPGSGVQCTQTPTSVTYGNPARITYKGVVCYARLHLGSFVTPAAVPIAYLTSASCPTKNPNCRIPNMRDPKSMGGYGVFGAGLTGTMSGSGRVPNPILTLPRRLGSVYSIVLSHEHGELVLGAQAPPGSAKFPLTSGTRVGEQWSLGNACVFVDGHPINLCMVISFDTGNGVPWFHNADSDAIPRTDGLVKPSTRLGFAPAGASSEATDITAGTEFARRIKLIGITGASPMTNVSVQAFFDHVVTYDNVHGTISFAPAPSTP